MPQQTDLNPAFGQQTLSVLNTLRNQGINKFSVIMRHSARNYDDDYQMEPFMSLTDEGRKLSFNYGAALPEGLVATFFSSYIGRCIETAYLIDKGYMNRKAGTTVSNQVSTDISPFYIVDFRALIDVILVQETPVFIRNWINGSFPESVIMTAEKTAKRMFSFIRQKFSLLQENSINVFVTHDWNMFLLKELGLGLNHEKHGAIEYLEGIILFEQNGTLMITNHQSEPQPYKSPD